MGFSEEVKNKVMVQCGRHCAVCRRFLPTMLQIHHIIPQSENGPDTFENAIPVCITCHSEIHTHRPFTQRFTQTELTEHRDRVYRLVEEGKLFGKETVQPTWVQNSFEFPSGYPVLSQDAIKLLSVAVDKGGGRVMLSRSSSGCSVYTADYGQTVPFGREEAAWVKQFKIMEEAGLIESAGYRGEVWVLTDLAYAYIDAVLCNSAVTNK